MTSKPKILIVEDDALIAMELEERIAALGYDVVSADTIEAAETLAEAEKPDAALLDANIRNQSSAALAGRLAAKGVRVAFCTGYDRIAGLSPELADAPIVQKPVVDTDLKKALERITKR